MEEDIEDGALKAYFEEAERKRERKKKKREEKRAARVRWKGVDEGTGRVKAQRIAMTPHYSQTSTPHVLEQHDKIKQLSHKQIVSKAWKT